jgi:ABC-type multidrug transport system ATPase subunit
MSGQVLAIMGSSGAGKTSLLNVLADRVDGTYKGEIRVNGHLLDANNRKSLSFLSGYVMQVFVRV